MEDSQKKCLELRVSVLLVEQPGGKCHWIEEFMSGIKFLISNPPYCLKIGIILDHVCGEGGGEGAGSCGQTPSCAIPATCRMVLSYGSKLLLGDYITTPGGTLFSTTPGGNRIIYDRKFLMECRNSPVAKTPPRDLPTIPGVTSPLGDEPATVMNPNHLPNSHEVKAGSHEESQIEMDIYRVGHQD
ncbi:eukaryotic translation initiation factor 4E-binding protein 1-like [Dromiciops gliroides]|uniref:eukaryotic translation initiation factor 4E-binding protein 1-like n=1 Tax=Dromiciops gliroides TaxID=33562 RepID=UPI001CC4E048|nr:eukaryotic translation initiation factor 4E-binding protein 1-like [Dromiciops gliroides]